ncbi:MAG: hypothetical protein IPH78_01340 [Bacteroidetes bacterium]|nr:hypothetical protein [Bacteroidota bacterium]
MRELLNEHTAIQLWVTRITLLLLLVYATYNTSVQQINEFILESSSPLNLAVFRLAHFGWLLWPAITAGKNPGLNIVYPYIDYPVTARLPVPGNEWLSMLVPVSPDITGPAIWLYNISLVLSFLGVATQFSTKVYAILTLYLCFIPSCAAR